MLRDLAIWTMGSLADDQADGRHQEDERGEEEDDGEALPERCWKEHPDFLEPVFHRTLN